MSGPTETPVPDGMMRHPKGHLVREDEYFATAEEARASDGPPSLRIGVDEFAEALVEETPGADDADDRVVELDDEAFPGTEPGAGGPYA